MTLILDPKLGQVERDDAAPEGRFLNTGQLDTQTEHNPDAFLHAELFCAKYLDILPEAPAVILRAGVQPDGQLTDLEQPHDKVATLIFDARRRDQTRYLWELIVAKSGEGMSVWQLGIASDNSLAVVRKFDAQSNLRSANFCDYNLLGAQIFGLANSDAVAVEAQELRRKRTNAELELTQFAVEGLTKYAPRLYDKKLAQREEVVARIGFVPTSILE